MDTVTKTGPKGPGYRGLIAFLAAVSVTGLLAGSASAKPPWKRTTTTTTPTATTSTTSTTTSTTTTSTTTSTTSSTTLAPASTSCVGVTVQPGESLQAKFDAHVAGTTFCIAPGVHRVTSSARPKSGNKILGSPGAIFNGSRLVSTFGRSGAFWTIPGQTQAFTMPATQKCAPLTYSGCRHPEAVFRNDTSLSQVMSLAELSAGEFYFDYAADTIYLADDPTSQKTEVAVATGALYGSGGELGQKNVTVSGLIFEKFASDYNSYHLAPVNAGWYWVIENNEMRLNSRSAAQVNNGVVLRNNNMHHNGQYAFEGGPLVGLTVEGNDIIANNTSGFDENDDAGGSKIIRSSNVIFRDNDVNDNRGPGLWADWENYNVTYDNNRVHRNSGPGIFHEASAKAVISNNVLSGNGTQFAGSSLWSTADIFLNDSKDTEIYGNNITAGVHGIGLVDIDRGSTAYGLLEIRNVYVHNNTIKLPAGGQTGMAGNRPANFTTANARFEANTYIVPNTSGVYWRWNEAVVAFASWRAVPQDAGGSVTQG